MAVTIQKKTLTLVRLIERMFSPEAVKGGLLTKAQELQAAGFQLVIHPTAFLISGDTGKEMTSVASVPLKLEAVTLAMKNQLGVSIKSAIRKKITYLINTAHVHTKKDSGTTSAMTMNHPDVYAAFVKHYVKGGNKVKAIKAVYKLTGLGLKEAKDQCDLWQLKHDDYMHTKKEHEAAKIAPVEGFILKDKPTPSKIIPGGAAMKHSTKIEGYYNPHAEFSVPLAEATMLHQPVLGTSDGSRYHVIAISDKVAVAVRIKKNNNMAIRAVCRDHPNTKVAQHAKVGFVAAGLKKANTGGHYSIHLEPETFIMVKKCIGSILFAMGGNFSAISDRVAELVGVGK